MSKVIVGLDIGTTKIACFVGRRNDHGKIEILSMGKTESLGVMRGMVSNIEKTINSITGAVEEAQNRVDGQLRINTVNGFHGKNQMLGRLHLLNSTGLGRLNNLGSIWQRHRYPSSLLTALQTM